MTVVSLENVSIPYTYPVCNALFHFNRVKTIRLYHHSCGPNHRDTGEPGEPALDELFLDSLPMSRFDILDGDEIHIDIDMQIFNALFGGHMKYLCVRSYLPKKFGVL